MTNVFQTIQGEISRCIKTTTVAVSRYQKDGKRKIDRWTDKQMDTNRKRQTDTNKKKQIERQKDRDTNTKGADRKTER